VKYTKRGYNYKIKSRLFKGVFMDKALETMKYIGKLLIRCVIFILGFSYDILVKFILWNREKYKNFEFNEFYELFFKINIISIFVSFFTTTSSRVNYLFVFLAVLQAILYITLLHKIIMNKKKFTLELYFEYMVKWSKALFFALFFNSVYIISVFPMIGDKFVYIMFISIFLIIHYYCRKIINKFIINWKRYSAYFLLLPLYSFLLWLIGGNILSLLLNMPVLASTKGLGYMTIILTVLIFNFDIYIAPKEIRSEVKVAVYLILALYSTISYCFFISDYLSEPVYNWFKAFEIGGTGFSKELVKSKVEWLTKWLTLPYLVGAVFGCFTLELVDRNDKVKQKDVLDNPPS